MTFTSRDGEAGGRKFQDYQNYSYLCLSFLGSRSLLLSFFLFRSFLCILSCFIVYFFFFLLSSLFDLFFLSSVLPSFLPFLFFSFLLSFFVSHRTFPFLALPCLSFPFLSFAFLSCPFLSFPFLPVLFNMFFMFCAFFVPSISVFLSLFDFLKYPSTHSVYRTFHRSSAQPMTSRSRNQI